MITTKEEPVVIKEENMLKIKASWYHKPSERKKSLKTKTQGTMDVQNSRSLLTNNYLKCKYIKLSNNILSGVSWVAHSKESPSSVE